MGRRSFFFKSRKVREKYKNRPLFVESSAASYPELVVAFQDSFRHRVIAMLFRVIATVASLACIVHGALAPVNPDDAVTILNDLINDILDSTENLTDGLSNSLDPLTVQTAAQVGRGHLARIY